MRGFVWSQVRYRRNRVLVLALAILVAAVSFVLLTSSAKTSSLQIQGTIKTNFRPAYDILVRPRGSKTPLEGGEALVRPNYLSGIFGGITVAQYRRIQRIRGVDVAAPIANIGYLLPFQNVLTPLNRFLGVAPFQLYRVDYAYVADRGQSLYPGAKSYVYYTTRDRLVQDLTRGLREIFRGGELRTNIFFYTSLPRRVGPFAPQAYLSFYSKLSPGSGDDWPVLYPTAHPGVVSSVTGLYFPMFIAAIDPVQEARLVHLDRTIVTGRYLPESEGVRIEKHGRHVAGRYVPVIASRRTYLGEGLRATIYRLRVPKRVAVPAILATPRAYSFVTGLTAQRLARVRVPIGPLYERMLGTYCGGEAARPGILCSFSYWSPSQVRYREDKGESLRPVQVTNPSAIWKSPVQPNGYWPAPGSNRDVQFRRVTEHVGSNRCGPGGSACNLPAYKIVGRYDPTKLPGFSPLSRVPLETYHPPLLEPADTRTSTALGGKPLLPTQNLGGYIQQPPLLLTTLQAIRVFYRPLSSVTARSRRCVPGEPRSARCRHSVGGGERSSVWCWASC